MFMSYYKRPELMILDENHYPWFGQKNNKSFWLSFSHLPIMVCHNTDIVQQSDKENQMSLMSVSAQMNTEIGLGKYAQKIKNVYYASEMFSKAMDKALEKLDPLIREEGILQSVHEQCVIMDKMMTFFFLDLKDGSKRLITVAKEQCMFVADFDITPKGFANVEAMTLRRDGMTGKDFIDMITYAYEFLLFKKYGNVEIETIPANKMVRKSQILGEKVNNFMGIDVQVLDSRWFTTICREEGFLVSGHFRLQPCKDEQGEWTRKLIYISPYAKHGYHRLAPIVNIEKE